MTVTLYLPPDERALLKAAKKKAKLERTSVSALFQSFIRLYVGDAMPAKAISTASKK